MSVIQIPKASGKIAFDTFAEDLRNAFANAPAESDSSNAWRAVAARALQLAGIVVPEEKD